MQLFVQNYLNYWINFKQIGIFIIKNKKFIYESKTTIRNTGS